MPIEDRVLVIDTMLNKDAKLAVQYEAIRRREYELITQLLELLPRIEGMSDERVAQVRDALFHADNPFLMVFIGPFSSGKSSLINALIGAPDLLPVGPVPTTDRISVLRYGEEFSRARTGEVDTVFYPSPLLQKISFVDTPGLESVLTTHEEQTRRFLHRSDAVLLVMLATQAMSARNIDYLRTLKEYDKRVILILNQIDLLSPEDAETVRAYVMEQSQDQLGFQPEVWMMSARRGLEARRADGELDEELWKESGLYRIEQYVDQQLNDAARLRQKLQTPLHIVQNAHQIALEAVRENQAALDQYQGIAANVEQQLSVYRRELDRIVRENREEVASLFTEMAQRGGAAIRDMFQLSRAFALLGRAIIEFLGLGRLGRPAGAYTRAAFAEHKVFEPLDELPTVVDKLGPRLEGKDVQDVDDLVKYARREIDALPEGIRTKVIGTVQAPLQYDRSALQAVRAELDAIETEARTIEMERLEQTVRNTLIYLGAWEALLIIFGIVVIIWNPSTPEMPLLPVLIVLVLLVLGTLGLLLLPLRGRMLAVAYANRVQKLQNRYLEVLGDAAAKQVDYGMSIRRDAAAPLTRLIEAQTELQTEQLSRLQATQQEMVKIEAELAAMGR
jgi:GTP-binding protein EngB required for normal cell division